MTTSTPVLEPSFLARQRVRLLALRADLSRTLGLGEEEARQALASVQGQANEAEDQAQDLALAENHQLVSGQLASQRANIDRALAKLDEGTYGISDISGTPIPMARLEALPQALVTVSEERDRSAERPR